MNTKVPRTAPVLCDEGRITSSGGIAFCECPGGRVEPQPQKA